MKTQKQTINEMISPRIIAEARKLGYSRSNHWEISRPKFQTVAVYYEKEAYVSMTRQSPGNLWIFRKNVWIGRNLITILQTGKIGGKPLGRDSI